MKTILVVDDSKLNRSLLQSILTPQDYEVQEAENGLEALSIARETPPDLIISDILMPKMDGFALCREWKSDDQLKHIPFVFYSATYTDSDDERFGFNLGADRYLIKPLKPSILIANIKDVFQEAGKKTHDAPPVFQDEKIYLKEYNQTLVRKLQDKLVELENTCKQLKSEIANHETFEKNLDEPENKYVDLYENAPDMYMAVNAQTGLVEKCNQTLAKKLGYSKAQLIGTLVLDLYHPNSRKKVEEIYKNIEMNGEIKDIELQLQKSNSASMNVKLNISALRDKNGDILYTRSVLRDISDQKQNEQLLQQVEKRYATLFENMSEGMAQLYVIFNEQEKPQDFKFIDINPGFVELTGMSRENVVGQTVMHIFAKVQDNPSGWIAKYSRVVLNGEVLAEEEYVQAWDKWFFVHAFKIDADRFAVTFCDITERKKAENKLAENMQHLEKFVELRTAELEQKNKELLKKQKKS